MIYAISYLYTKPICRIFVITLIPRISRSCFKGAFAKRLQFFAEPFGIRLCSLIGAPYLV